jgi:hypothetical protein
MFIKNWEIPDWLDSCYTSKINEEITIGARVTVNHMINSGKVVGSYRQNNGVLVFWVVFDGWQSPVTCLEHSTRLALE